MWVAGRKHTPSASKKGSPVFALDKSWVLNCLPRQLREGPSSDQSTFFHLPKTILLTVASIKDIVRSKEHSENRHVGGD